MLRTDEDVGCLHDRAHLHRDEAELHIPSAELHAHNRRKKWQPLGIENARLVYTLVSLEHRDRRRQSFPGMQEIGRRDL